MSRTRPCTLFYIIRAHLHYRVGHECGHCTNGTCGRLSGRLGELAGLSRDGCQGGAGSLQRGRVAQRHVLQTGDQAFSNLQKRFNEFY